MDGFLVKSIWIYSYPGCCVSLDRGQKLAITGYMALWMSQMVLSESPIASAACFVTAILLMVNLHAFSFSKKTWTFSTICLVYDLRVRPSTICLVYDLSITPFLPGVRATLCSSELLELPAPSADLLFGPIPTYYV